MVAAKKLKPVEMIGDLEPMLIRLKLTAIRDELETLLEQAARRDEPARGTDEAVHVRGPARTHGASRWAFRSPSSIRAHAWGSNNAQPSLDLKQIRDFATSRSVDNGDSVR